MILNIKFLFSIYDRLHIEVTDINDELCKGIICKDETL